jgi:hypothetical protein
VVAQHSLLRGSIIVLPLVLLLVLLLKLVREFRGWSRLLLHAWLSSRNLFYPLVVCMMWVRGLLSGHVMRGYIW